MIRIKMGLTNVASNHITRSIPNVADYYMKYAYPLNGESQVISDSKVTYQRKPIVARIRRVRRDQIGNVVKVKKPKIRGSRLQPFTMNPVLIQKTESKCDEQVIVMPHPFGVVTFTGRASATANAVGTLFQTVPTAVPVDVPTENKAIINCLKKLSSPKNLDLGVGIAELGDTLRFLNSPLSSMLKLFRRHKASTFQRLNKVKTRRRATARELSEAAADTWLSYRYAFSPLASDITGIMIEATEKLCTSSKILRRVSGRAKKLSWSNPTAQSPAALNASMCYIYFRNGVVRQSTEQTITAVQLYRYRPFFEDAIHLASLGLSPTQLGSFVWEKIPFSFVADWGVNIGDWLRAWEPKPWIQLEGSCVSTKTDQIVTVDGAEMNVYINWYKCSSCFARRVQLSRVVKTLTLPRAPVISQDVLNLSRTLDSLSLAWKPISSWLQTFRRR